MFTVDQQRAEFRQKINIDVIDNYDALQILQALFDENIFFELGADIDDVTLPDWIDDSLRWLIGAQLQLIAENLRG
jgi:hypothetical protein